MEGKKKTKVVDKIRLRSDAELAKLPRNFLEIPTLDWEAEPYESSDESESDEENEVELTGIWRAKPDWESEEKLWDPSNTWEDLPGVPLGSTARDFLQVKKSHSAHGKLEKSFGVKFNNLIGVEQRDTSVASKLPIYRPWWDKEPLPGVEVPRFVWQVESESDLTSDRKIKVVEYHDNSVLETNFRVFRKNMTTYINVATDEEVPEEINELLSLDVLETIRPVFNNGPLSLEQYKKAISSALKLDDDPDISFPPSLIQLFTRIDTFAIDKISWDDLCDFLQQQFAEKAETDYNSPKVALIPPVLYPEIPHRMPITKAFTLADKGLMCFSEDGMISLWTKKFKPRIYRKLGRQDQRSMDISDKKVGGSKWFTDMVYLPRLSKFLVSTGDKELQFYDTATYDSYCQVTNLFSVPVHIDAKLTQQMQLVVCMGDINGYVTILIVNNAIATLRNWSQQKRVGSVPTISISDAVGEVQGVKYLKYHVHDDMISHIYYCLSMNKVITSSIGVKRSLLMGDILTHWNANELIEVMTSGQIDGISDVNMKPKTRKASDEVNFPIKGCRTFDVCEEKKLLAAGGLDRLVWVWNIYVPSQPVAKFRGHNAALFRVVFDLPSGTLFSICTDKTIRIWQLLTNTCMQAVDVKSSKIKGQILQCFHPTTHGVLIQTNDDCNFFKIKRQGDIVKDEETTALDPITAVIYNPQHEFIVTCSAVDISVWDCETGKLKAEFNTIGGDGSMHIDTIAEMKESPMEEENIFIMPKVLLHGREIVDTYNVGTVTCVAFDNMGRRFFTAHANGVIKAWNFYNGRNLYNLYKPLDNNVICDMHYVTINAEHRYLITVGWDRKVVVYVDTQGPEVVHQPQIPEEPLQFTDDKFGHKDDIWACTFGYPNLIASGDYSGRLLVWNINSARIVGYLKPNQPKPAIHMNDKFITSLTFFTTTIRQKKTTYLVSSGPYHLMHIWRANTTRELNIGSVGWTRPCDMPRDYVTCIKTVPENNLLICADTWGCVSIWTIEDQLQDPEPTSWFKRRNSSRGPRLSSPSTSFSPPGTHNLAPNATSEEEMTLGPSARLQTSSTKSQLSRKQTSPKMSPTELHQLPWAVSDHFDKLDRNELESMKSDMSELLHPSVPQSAEMIPGSVISIAEPRRHTLHRKKDRVISKGYGSGPVQLKFMNGWKCHADGFACLEVCNTYGLIATGGKDRAVRIWDYGGNYIGNLGQNNQWLIGDPTSYRVSVPSDVTLDMKRIRVMDFFKVPVSPLKPFETRADEIVKEMLKQAERPRITDWNIQMKAKAYECLPTYSFPTTLWIQPNAPIGPFKSSPNDMKKAELSPAKEPDAREIDPLK